MTYGQDLLNKLQSTKDTDGNKLILEKTRGTLTGTAIGLGIGLAIGYSRNYNLFVSAFIGAALGGLISKYFISKD